MYITIIFLSHFISGKNQNYKNQFQQYAEWEKNYAYHLSSSSDDSDDDSEDDDKNAGVCLVNYDNRNVGVYLVNFDDKNAGVCSVCTTTMIMFVLRMFSHHCIRL